MDGTSQEHIPQKAPGTVKHSYTIACSSTFRDAVEAMAARRQVNVGDIARSVLLVMPAPTIAAFADPGEPLADDRETVILKSGPSQGRPWRRKPRLQVRMVPGFDVTTIRRALGLALVLERGELILRLEDPNAPPPQPTPEPPPKVDVAAETIAASHQALAEVNEELERLQAIVSVLAFEPLPDGITSRADALHVLGFPPSARPDRRMVRARFRMLATIHHPDSNYGSHHRMSQLNQAMEVLKE